MKSLFMFVAAVLFMVLIARGSSPAQTNENLSPPTKSLLVVAHPDDEYELAGTVYRMAKELGGIVDQLIITDGEGGFRYSSLASSYYGVNLTDEAVGRANLPHIREQEARQAAKVLGIRNQWFLNQRDDHFTVDEKEAVAKWDVPRVSAELINRLRNGKYDVVFVLLTPADDHGEHKAATVLTLRAVQTLPQAEKPVVIGALAGPDQNPSYTQLKKFPITATTSEHPLFHFDRDTHFGFNDALSYRIVVDWVIAEHKSQGLFQTKPGQDRFENFWLFAIDDSVATHRARALFQKITPTKNLTVSER